MAKRTRQGPPKVFSTMDYFGNLVVLEDESWRSHIIDPDDGHPQLAGYEALIQSVVEQPEIIRESTQYCNSAAFISGPNVGPRPEGVRVLVQYADTSYQKGASSGKVTTAYPIDMVRYPQPRLGKVLYRRGQK